MKYFVFSIYMVGEYIPFRENTWEEIIRIYHDDTPEAAENRARNDAITNQISYETIDGYTLSWKLQKINLVNTLDDPIPDGTDAFYRSLTEKEANSLLDKIE